MPIQVEHLTHTYMPGSPFSAVALNDVSLTIEDGELIGLLGHTGSGKTTLVQHLNGLIKPTSGRVVVDGLDLTQKLSLIHISEPTRQAEISYAVFCLKKKTTHQKKNSNTDYK